LQILSIRGAKAHRAWIGSKIVTPKHRRLVLATLPLGLLSFIAVALAAQPSQYGGTTSQKVGRSALRITLAVSHGAVGNVQVGATATTGAAICKVTGAGTTFVFNKGSAKIAHKNFGGKLNDGHGDTMTIEGVVRSTTITGSFVVQTTGGAQGTQKCSSGKVTFKAQAAGGQADHVKYSGSIGPGYPISFRVSADGKAIDGLVLGYEVTTCGAAPANKAPTFHFKTLAIRSGSFAGSSEDDFGPGDSASIRIAGTMFGRTATGQVTGTQRITSLPTCTQSENFTATAK
jgi:hypothetical protein